MSFLKLVASAILAHCWLAALCCAQSPVCIVKQNQVGPIALGMTILEAKELLPNATIQAPPADGEKLYKVMRGKSELMHLYVAGGSDHKPARISVIRVFDIACATTAGARVGFSLPAVEKRYGKLTGLQMSETESREFATFERQPAWLALEVNGARGSAGEYAAGQRTTQKLAPGAKVLSYWVSNQPAAK